MDDIYRENIIEHYKTPKNWGKIKSFDGESHEENVSCGDKLSFRVKLSLDTTKIRDLSFWGEGCAITVASASLLSERVKGISAEKALSLTSKDVLKIIGINLSPARLKCALLPLEVLQKALLASIAKNKI